MYNKGKYSEVNQNNYLLGHANLNDHIFEGRNFGAEEENRQMELELTTPEEIKAVLSRESLSLSGEYDSAYIVIYEIHEETKLISSIKLTLPNSQTMKLVVVEDLTELISESEYEVKPEHVESLKDDLFEDTIFSGDLGDYHDEEDLPREEEELEE